MLPASMVQQAATTAGFPGLDLDGSSAWGAWLAARFSEVDSAVKPIRAVWIPACQLHSARTRGVVEAIAKRQEDLPPRLVASIVGGTTLNELTRLLVRGGWLTQPVPVVLGLPSAALKGGRPHLVQLGTLKRFAEEWNLAIALDLSGAFDPTWEAEAAVARLGDRLTLLRVNASAPSRSAVGRDRVACRALQAAMDRDQLLEVAVAPGRTVPFPITPRVASREARRAADYLFERAALHARALREGISHFEGSPSSRGI